MTSEASEVEGLEPSSLQALIPLSFPGKGPYSQTKNSSMATDFLVQLELLMENGKGCHFVLGASKGMAYLEKLPKRNQDNRVMSLI